MAKASVTAAYRRARSVELALEGNLTYEQIADRVGYAHRGSVSKAISRALKERTVEAVDALRAIELERLDRLQAAIWHQALDGDLAATVLAVRILDKRARLLGLYQRQLIAASDSLFASPTIANR